MSYKLLFFNFFILLVCVALVPCSFKCIHWSNHKDFKDVQLHLHFLAKGKEVLLLVTCLYYYSMSAIGIAQAQKPGMF